MIEGCLAGTLPTQEQLPDERLALLERTLSTTLNTLGQLLKSAQEQGGAQAEGGAAAK